MKIYHGFKSEVADDNDETKIQPQRDWNSNHVDEDGNPIDVTIPEPVTPQLPPGTYRFKKEIEPIEIPVGTPVSSVTFANLNGDIDLEYEIDFDIAIIAGGTEQALYIKPNNIGSGFYEKTVFGYGAAACDNNSPAQFVLGRAGWNLDGQLKGDGKLYAKTGIKRNLISKSFFDAGAANSHTMLAGSGWNDTSTNITSLVLALTNNGTFSGTIILSKIITIVIE